MCDATAAFAATTAMSLFGAITGAQSDYDQYNRKLNAINAESDAINRSTVFKYRLQGLQEQQIQNKKAVDIQNLELKGEEAKGTAAAAAATGGVEGNSVQALLNSFDVATGHDISTVRSSSEGELQQVSLEKQGTHKDAEARQKALRYQIPEDPSSRVVGRFLTAGLQIGTSYASLTTPVKGADGVTRRRFG